MAVERQAAIQHHAENFHLIRHHQVDAGNGHGRYGRCSGLQLTGSANDQGAVSRITFWKDSIPTLVAHQQPIRDDERLALFYTVVDRQKCVHRHRSATHDDTPQNRNQSNSTVYRGELCAPTRWQFDGTLS